MEKYLLIIILIIIIYLYAKSGYCNEIENFATVLPDVTSMSDEDVIKTLSVVTSKIQEGGIEVKGNFSAADTFKIIGPKGTTIFNKANNENYIYGNTDIDGNVIINKTLKVECGDISNNSSSLTTINDPSQNYICGYTSINGSLTTSGNVKIINNLTLNEYTIDKTLFNKILNRDVCPGFLSDISNNYKRLYEGVDELGENSWKYVHVFKGWSVILAENDDSDESYRAQRYTERDISGEIKILGGKKTSVFENKLNWTPIKYEIPDNLFITKNDKKISLLKFSGSLWIGYT